MLHFVSNGFDFIYDDSFVVIGQTDDEVNGQIVKVFLYKVNLFKGGFRIVHSANCFEVSVIKRLNT